MSKIIATICMMVMLSIIFVPATLGIAIEPYCGTEGEYKLEKSEVLEIGDKQIMLNNVHREDGLRATIGVRDSVEYGFDTLRGCEIEVINDVKVKIIQIHSADDEDDKNWIAFNILNEEDFTEPVTEPVSECGDAGEYALNKDESIHIGTKKVSINNINEIGTTERIGVTIQVSDDESHEFASLFACETKLIDGLKITVNDFNFDGTDLGDDSWVKFTIDNEEDFEIVIEEPVVEEPLIELEPVCWTTNYLLEGEMNSYKVGENVYDVFLTSVYHDDVKFTINGENTRKLNERDSYSLTDGATLSVYKVVYQAFAGGVHSASFCFDGKAGESVVELIEEEVFEELTCGDSYGGDGYYSACERDVIKHETGIEFGVLPFDEDSLKLKVFGPNKILTFNSLREVIKFRYNGNIYKVEYNHYNPERITIFISHMEDTEEFSESVVIIDREVSEVTEEIFVPDTECGTCEKDGNCLPFGTRLLEDGKPVYCGINSKLNTQESLGEFCQNNYECLSNQCSNGQCIDLSEQLEETQSFLEKILFWLRKIFG